MRHFLIIGLLRLLTGMAQFAAIVLLTATLSLGELGTYSLLVIFLTYAAQLAGLNLNTFVLREQGTTPRSEWPALLQRQWTFLAVSTTIVSLSIAALHWSGLLQVPTIGWFLVLLTLTTFNMQHESFLLGAGRATSAAFNLLFRTGWVYILAIINWLHPGEVSLETVLIGWTLAELLGCCVVVAILARDQLLPSSPFMLDRKWLKHGLGIGAQYTVLGLFLIVSFSVQRVVIGGVEGAAAVGIFHFFYATSVFGPNLLEASLFAILLPKLIARAKNLPAGELGMPPLWSFALLGGLGLVGLSVLYFLLPLGIGLLGKAELTSHMGLFPLTAGYAIFYTLARVFHYGLYSANADRWLLGVNAVACVVACATSFAFIGGAGITGGGWSLLLTGMVLLAGNSLPYWSETIRRIALARHQAA